MKEHRHDLGSVHGQQVTCSCASFGWALRVYATIWVVISINPGGWVATPRFWGGGLWGLHKILYPII